MHFENENPGSKKAVLGGPFGNFEVLNGQDL